MRLSSILGGAALLGAGLLASPAAAQTSYPIQYGFLWHMHQPNYYPYESIVQTDANGRYSFSVVEVHNSRGGRTRRGRRMRWRRGRGWRTSGRR